MEVISVASGIITILQAGSGIALGANHLRHEIAGLPARLRMNQHRISSLKAAIEVAKRQINSQDPFSPTQLQLWAIDYIQHCGTGLEVASGVINVALQHVEAQAKLKRKLSSVKLVLGPVLSRTEQQLQDMTQMLGLYVQSYLHMGISILSTVGTTAESSSSLSLYSSQEAQLDIFSPFSIYRQSSFSGNDMCRMCTIERRDMVQSEPRSPLNKTDSRAGPLLDELNAGFIGGILKEHQEKIAQSSKWPLPLLVLSRSWKLLLQKRKRGYLPYSLRVYSVRPGHDAIIRAVSRGDLNEMLELFSTKKASPFVRDAGGCSLLHYAACSFNLSVCKRLLSLGLADCVDEATSYGLTPGHIILMNSVWNDERYKWESIHEIMEILKEFSSEIGYGQSPWVFLLGCSTTTTIEPVLLAEFQRLAAPGFFQQPTPNLIQAARTYVIGGRPGRHPNPGIFMYLLGQKSVDTLCVLGTSAKFRVALLHTATIGLIRYTRPMRPLLSLPIQSRQYREGRKLWRAICRVFIQIMHDGEIYDDDSIHFDTHMKVYSHTPVVSWTGSPLISAIHGLFLDEFLILAAPIQQHQIGSQLMSRNAVSTRQRGLFHILSSGIKNWLQGVSDSGVNMVAYGKKEKELFFARKRVRPGPLEYEARIRRSRQNNLGSSHETLPICLFDFEYSSIVNNWNFHWRVDTERLVGEFWQMIESSGGGS